MSRGAMKTLTENLRDNDPGVEGHGHGGREKTAAGGKKGWGPK